MNFTGLQDAPIALFGVGSDLGAFMCPDAMSFRAHAFKRMHACIQVLLYINKGAPTMQMYRSLYLISMHACRLLSGTS